MPEHLKTCDLTLQSAGEYWKYNMWGYISTHSPTGHYKAEVTSTLFSVLSWSVNFGCQNIRKATKTTWNVTNRSEEWSLKSACYLSVNMKCHKAHQMRWSIKFCNKNNIEDYDQIWNSKLVKTRNETDSVLPKRIYETKSLFYQITLSKKAVKGAFKHFGFINKQVPATKESTTGVPKDITQRKNVKKMNFILSQMAIFCGNICIKMVSV